MDVRFSRLARRFPRRRVFITGGGSGLGLELARALGVEGWAVGLFDRNLERLTQVEAELAASNINVVAYPGDVTQADELTVAVNSFAGIHDGLDVMINNAGIAAGGALMEAALEDWRSLIDVNLMGVVHGCRAAIPHLQRNGSGLLINIASAAAFGSAPRMPIYNATKAAVLSLSETLVGELREYRTQVSVVMPTFFVSNLLDSYRGPDTVRETARGLMRSSACSAKDVAGEVLKRASAGELHIVLPFSARVLWKLKRWMPTTYVRRLLPLVVGKREGGN